MDELCNRLAKDLDQAFPDLVEQMKNPLYAGLRRIHGADAEDLAQEAFIRAYRALQAYDTDRIRALKLNGWMWTIALNLGRNALRSRSRRPTAVEYEPERHGHDDPELVDEAAWDRRFAELPPAQRKAVVLRHVVGLSVAETAEALDRPVGTVKADVHRGLARLRSVMEAES
jgi:RNA polymerase sigma-70 factor (ECF subfamily)